MKKSILAIELDDYVLKIIQARPTTKGWSVEKFGTLDISGKSENDVIIILKDILHKLKIKKSNSILVMPRSLVTVRYLQLPTTNPNELDNMIDIQVVRQIPYTREEMVFDYHIIGITAEGFTKVLLAIVHRDIISKYLRILEKSGITPYSIELDSLAIMELFNFLISKDAKLSAEEKPMVLLDVDYANTNILVLQRGAPVFTRSISIGAIQLSGKTPPTAGKDWITEWLGEINRSISALQREQAVPVEKILTVGDFSSQIIHDMTAKLGLPLFPLSLGQYLEGESVFREKLNISISDLLGVVKKGTNTHVNLIPQEIRDFRVRKDKRRSLGITILLIAGIIGVLGLTVNKKIQDRKMYLESLEKRLQETSPAAKELEIKKDRLGLIKKQLSVNGSSLDVLRELYGIIPQKTSLNVFIYDDVQGVTIKGASPAMSEVFDLIPKLENSPYFEDVINRYATQRKIRGQELTEFHIDCSITSLPEGA